MSSGFPTNTGNFSAFESAAQEARDCDTTRDASSRGRIQPPIAPATSFPSLLERGGHSTAKRSLGVGRQPIERTELERRVLAHERILQALISHIAEEQPEILARLKATFGNGHNLGEYEQDYTSTEHYGDQFIRKIETLIARRLD